MALKFALFAVVCIAQGFAFKFPSFERENGCKNIAIPFEFDKTMAEMNGVREEVSMAAMEAYARDSNIEIVVACFRQEARDYVRLGRRISKMMRDASMEMAEKLQEKAEKYAKLMEEPMKKIAITMAELPEVVANHIKNKEFVKAAEAMVKAREIVEENSRILGKMMRDMAAEVPEMADRVEEMAKEIYQEAQRSSESIRMAFRKCVAEGGPSGKNEASSSEEDDDSSAE